MHTLKFHKKTVMNILILRSEFKLGYIQDYGSMVSMVVYRAMVAW